MFKFIIMGCSYYQYSSIGHFSSYVHTKICINFCYQFFENLEHKKQNKGPRAMLETKTSS